MVIRHAAFTKFVGAVGRGALQAHLAGARWLLRQHLHPAAFADVGDWREAGYEVASAAFLAAFLNDHALITGLVRSVWVKVPVSLPEALSMSIVGLAATGALVTRFAVEMLML